MLDPCDFDWRWQGTGRANRLIGVASLAKKGRRPHGPLDPQNHMMKPGVTEIPKLEDANLAGTKHSEELQKKHGVSRYSYMAT